MALNAATHYELLEVAETAEPEAIRKAFMTNAKVWHPDKAPAAERPLYEEKFRQLSQAYETLSDPLERRDYDRTLHPDPPPAWPRIPGSVTPSGSPAAKGHLEDPAAHHSGYGRGISFGTEREVNVFVAQLLGVTVVVIMLLLLIVGRWADTVVGGSS